ncbi:unnamed protein product [Rotaria sp. Silwood1]|nr:unnamed protein product [Rotaria sp. Silwood1]CAF0967330.1 unnamed protein product [Rotaria sp. Silwood1]
MTYQNKSCVPSLRSFLFIITVIFAFFITHYIIPVRVPGSMIHPIKYKIITGTFAFVLDFSQIFESIIGIPYYKTLNTIVDSFDQIKIRSFDHGQVLYHDQYIEDVLVRIYTPSNMSKTFLSPVIIFFHGGGFFFGSIYSHDTMTYHMSMYSGAKVISVNYRLTPNVHYPIPIEDSVKVVRYVMDNYQEFSIDPKQVFLCGDSAGGNIAVVVERQIRHEQKSIIRGVILLYPLLQLVNFRLPSYLTNSPYNILSILREDILTQVTNFYVNTSFAKNELFQNQHLSSDDYNYFYSKVNLPIANKDHLVEKSHPDTWKLFNENISPLLADDKILHNSPSTFIGACTYDVLLSDSQLYFERLQKLNVKDIVYREYRIFHGAMTFVDFPVAFNEAFDIIHDCAHYRLAPEYPFPTGLEDCYTVAKYLLEYQDSKKLHIDPTQITLADDSAGGSLAAIITMHFTTQSVEYFKFLYYTSYHKLSVYLNETINKSQYNNNHTSVEQKRQYQPITDDHEGDPSLIEKAKKALNPEVSPLLVHDEQLDKLPSTHILSVGHDRLRDEAFIYEGRLKRAGVQVVHHHYENTFHGSITFLYGSLALDIAREMVQDIVEYIKENL